MSTDLAALQLRTLLEFDADGYLLRNREPNGKAGPRLAIVRTTQAVAWAVRRDTPDEIAELAASERPAQDLRTPPAHADRYVEILGGEVIAGPAYLFPDAIPEASGVELTSDERVLEGLFAPDEIDGRWPIYAVIEDGRAVCTCCSSRLTDDAAEAGLFTVEGSRGRGFGPLVTVAWAAEIRRSGRVPLYSTGWSNTSSQRVAEKIGLVPYAVDFSVT